MEEKVKELVKQLTLEEKAALCSGSDAWNTKAVKDIPAVMMTDGPHGLRKQQGAQDNLGINESVASTCFPSSAAVANSWDRELIHEIGMALGRECRTEKVAVLLGPGANIKRSPLCGRNFEYFSEDPYLSGQMAEHYISGIQSQGVGACIKHFAVNNQETGRMGVDAVVDERALREIYLAGFEGAVRNARPWMVMSAYNKVNGTSCSENSRLLGEVLRDEWGYEGVVVSDWGAVNDRVDALRATLDLEMPYSGERRTQEIIAAVKDGHLEEAVLDQSAGRIIAMALRASESLAEDSDFDKEEHHALAVNAAAESMVLLKNEQGTLPLDKEQKCAIIGAFAEQVRYQGNGSSHVNPTKLLTLPEAWKQLTGAGEAVYAKGYDMKQDSADPELVEEALAQAAAADHVIMMIGLPDGWESEGYDRSHMRLPENQVQLLEELHKTGKPVTTVLFAGAPTEMPWLEQTDALIMAYTAGQGVMEALVKILTGEVNPCGKLAESYPVCLEHNSASLFYPQRDKSVYNEGIYVGYRYYDKKKLPVLFPFGYGRSYTSFEYADLCLDKTGMEDTDTLKVSLKVRNTGSRRGKEIVQIYVHDQKASVDRPEKELKAFVKTELEPGEEKTVTLTLDYRSFAYYDEEAGAWLTESGEFDIMAGASSRDIRLTKQVYVRSTTARRHKYTLDSPLGVLKDHPELLAQFIKGMGMDAMMGGEGQTSEFGNDPFGLVADIPMRKMISMSGGAFSEEAAEQLLDVLNQNIE